MSEVRYVLTREMVLDAAAAQAGELGLESVSSRAVAARLGVTPMALYRHVRDMDEIVASLVDGLIEGLGLPDPDLGWREWLEQLARSLRGLLSDSPAALALFNRRPVTTPAARARLEATVAMLAGSGFGPDEAARVYAAAHTYTIGFCSLEAGRRRRPPEPSGTLGDQQASELIVGFVTEEQFLFGLRALIAGVAPGREEW